MARPLSPKTIVSRIFAESALPIYLLDGDGTMLYSNQALAEWTQLPVATLDNAKCLYTGSESTYVWAQRLAVPPEAVPGGFVDAPVSCERNDGSVSVRLARFLPLQDDRDCTLVVVESSEYQETEDKRFDSHALHRQVMAMRQDWLEAYRLDWLIGQSPAMRRVRAQVRLATAQPECVVIVGNEGVGRETIARTIHAERMRAQAETRGSGGAMLIPLSCAVVDVESLQSTIESLVKQLAELEGADKSVLLLLEVDSLDMESQSALLGFLQIAEIGLQTLATSRSSLLELAKQDRFRPDLAYHLSTLELLIPPLVDRLEDVPLLAHWMLERQVVGTRVSGFTEDAMEAMLRYGWPKEVSELREVVEFAATQAVSSKIDLPHLPQRIRYALDAAALPPTRSEEIQLDAFLAEIERELIARALAEAKGNRAQASRALGISRAKLLRRIDQLGVHYE